MHVVGKNKTTVKELIQKLELIEDKKQVIVIYPKYTDFEWDEAKSFSIDNVCEMESKVVAILL